MIITNWEWFAIIRLNGTDTLKWGPASYLNPSMVEDQIPLRARYVLEAVRQLANDSGIYRINPGHPSEDLEAMYDYWHDGHITIGTWNIPPEKIFPDLNEGDTITSNDLNPALKNPVSKGIDQSELTPLVEEYSSTDSPGRAAGSIARFFNDLTEGTGILGNMEGTAPGVVDGPAVFKPNGPADEAANTHVFVRPVTWADAPDGGVLEIPHSDLPSPLRPTPTTCTELNDSTSLLDLTSMVGFFAEQSTR